MISGKASTERPGGIGIEPVTYNNTPKYLGANHGIIGVDIYNTNQSASNTILPYEPLSG
jgi:hypothetical protein